MQKMEVYMQKIKNKEPSTTPFVKWVGGKKMVINNHLYKYLPDAFDRYVEPFVGGGAMFFHLNPKKALINDLNNELIISYNQIKTNYKQIIKLLDSYKEQHNENFYYSTRKSKPTNKNEITARLMYLNKTCFNGMFRVNSKGEFNVPFNNVTREKLTLYNKENITRISQRLNENNIDIKNLSYEKILQECQKDDFIFCDPPYDYEEGIKGFVSYTKNQFNRNDQTNLFIHLDTLNKIGVKWMITNHNTKFINELYKEYKIIPFKTNRSINSNGNNRKLSGKEVVIINYEK